MPALPITQYPTWTRRQLEARVDAAVGGLLGETTWPQVHIFRSEAGLIVEHWAVREDAALIDSVDA